MKKNFTVSKLSQLLQCEGQAKFQLKQLEKFIFEKKEITIFNQINSDNSRNDRQHRGNFSYLKLRLKNIADIPQTGRLLQSHLMQQFIKFLDM